MSTFQGIQTLKKFSFAAFDVNSDDCICEIDVMVFLKKHMEADSKNFKLYHTDY